MRFVIKGEIPDVLKTPKLISEWNKIAKKEQQISVKNSISDVLKKELLKYYQGKCAYCEQITGLQLEHYRPKSKYYWLVYEWTNLLPACSECNSKKGTQFPIHTESERVNLPNFKDDSIDFDACKPNNEPLKNEKPYILHPEFDNPTEFLRFQMNDKQLIEICGKDEQKRGETTIGICDLNRDNLLIQRQLVIQGFVSIIRKTFKFATAYSIPENKIIKLLSIDFEQFNDEIYNEKNEFILLRNFIFENADNFISIVAPYFSENQGVLIANAFKYDKKKL